MTKFLIKIEKEDINTSKIGNNILLSISDNVDIVLTPDALEELFNDYNQLKDIENS